ncbi:aspartyl-tRNA(Asn)/glutamyl-tRNA (Gln) amidotransferase subunit B [Thermosulfidibacter takaii ABI70S6]|uniref:Aspartyl/glutamyl-tRNA(Asn/Gln) amidotransferase subunit B n=1 Tax=Thermosulfidibacter takaii (strain DSM 17441 / JCM 13301 / NBRC 103674 / ABI70S6) TaxID=1298851 RepID=A0A0S3QR47_THET7|nr:Asp-tRNA(Asn)/Glu-tRNA(Gln) amidotransferase subunit GatB [Thermosulfidibacter takaii]BAT70816.1 aspartyl-tRNA(Asn)/glutamyl-tRNA (Gln) amidotransferase subunit B [Thermosulfidibacter takaii ABI70S6]
MKYEAVIGLEVHVQLNTKSKIFCSCSTEFGAPPNTHVCPVCLGMPGSLPVLNKRAVEYAVKAALALNCTINLRSIFARKNYFYPDLPKGYQISQYEEPLAENGYIEIETESGSKRIRIRRVHMEEDAGKNIHGEGDDPFSYVDLNRAGIPLIEIVSEPDISSPEEARLYLQKLRTIMRYIGVSNADMEKGELRCDANISVRPVGSDKLGTKTELKNMNSFRHVQRALEYEIERQISVLEEGGTIVQETRLWNPQLGITETMRKKEEEHDYRYFPEPDLVPLVLSEDFVNRCRVELPELPDEKKRRFMEQYKLPAYDSEVLCSSRELADFYEQAVAVYNNPKGIANWVMVELLGRLNKEGKDITQSPVNPGQVAKLVELIDKGTISGKIGKQVFDILYTEGGDPESIVKERGLVQITDTSQIEKFVGEVISECTAEVQKYLKGKTKVIGYLVGQVMKKSRGKANPQLVNELLRKKLDAMKE